MLCIFQCRSGVCQFSFSESSRDNCHFYKTITPGFHWSGFSAVNSPPPCQNVYRALSHWFTQFCTVWGDWSRSDDHNYFASHVWAHLVRCLPKSCMLTRNVLWILNLFRHGQPLTGHSAPTGPPCRCCLPWRHHLFTWFTWPPLWLASHFVSKEIFIAREQCILHSVSDHR